MNSENVKNITNQAIEQLIDAIKSNIADSLNVIVRNAREPG